MTPRNNALVWRLVVPAVVALLPLSLVAQNSLQTPDEVLKQESYQTPPKELADAVLATRYLNVSLTNASPDKKWFVDEIGDGPVVMKTFAKPFHELGGLFVDFKANRARPLTVRNNIGIQIISAADGSKKQVQLPAGARVSNATWSPDSKSIAFYVHGEDATHIWVADAATGVSHQVTKTPVLATLVTTFDFTKDGKQIATVLIPDGRAAMPQVPATPPGPSVKLALETDKNRLRTFPSLMTTPYEEQLLEWHATGQLALVSISNGSVKKIGKPAMIRALDVSPDGKYIRVTRMTRPFSYDVPVSSFGQVEEIWDDQGKALAKVGDRALNLGVQDDTQPVDPQAPPAGGGGGRGAQQTGKREVAWRTDGQGLTYVEQEPAPANARNGRAAGADTTTARPSDNDDRRRRAADAARAPQRKDRVYQWTAPFGAADQKVIYENPTRISGPPLFARHADPLLQRAPGTEHHRVGRLPGRHVEEVQLARYRTDDVYANPGSIVSRSRRRRRRPCGRRRRRARRRRRDRPRAALGRRQQRLLPGQPLRQEPERRRAEELRRQGRDQDRREAAYLRERQQGQSTSASRPSSIPTRSGSSSRARARPTCRRTSCSTAIAASQLTKNVDPHPDLTSAKVERFVVERPDGFKFRVKVTLPPDYQRRHAAAGAVLVLPARVRDAGGLRPPRSHVQQERASPTSARARWSTSSASATRSSSPTRRSSARRDR